MHTILASGELEKITTLGDVIVFNRFCDAFSIFVLRRFSDKIEHLCHHWKQHPILSRRFCLLPAGNAIESSANTGDEKKTFQSQLHQECTASSGRLLSSPKKVHSRIDGSASLFSAEKSFGWTSCRLFRSNEKTPIIIIMAT